MATKVLIVIVIVVLAVIALPIVLAQLKNQTASTALPAAAPSGDATPATSNPSMNQPPLLDAASLTGTAWTLSGFQVELQAGGVAYAPSTPFGAVSGTWTVNGSQITVKAMGQTKTATISGDKLFSPDGAELQRVR